MVECAAILEPYPHWYEVRRKALMHLFCYNDEMEDDENNGEQQQSPPPGEDPEHQCMI